MMRVMRLLVIGGTQFVGRAVVEAALSRGASVTTFNRGQSGPDVPGVEGLRGDRYDDESVAGLVALGPWDAVVDTSGYVPRNVLALAKALRRAVKRFVFMSTVSVYADWPARPLSDESAVLPCPADADSNYGEDVEDGPTRYGYQKAGCEAAVSQVFGDHAAILRPGVVLGPREYVGRLPWWLGRIRRGGRVLAPGHPSRGIQPIDVRDLAEFAMLMAEGQLSGPFNVTAPIDGATFGDLLEACVDVTHSRAALVWVPDEVLLTHGIRQWSQLPLWRTFDGVWRVDAARARAAGLVNRPIAQTVLDTWKWMGSQESVGANERSDEIGIDAAAENRVLATLGQSLPGETIE
jgi:nucleoside-diphosphate-sugar epimerase